MGRTAKTPEAPTEKLDAMQSPSNDAAAQVGFTIPYSVKIRIEGVSPILFHRWSCESVAEKAGAAKGSKAKKTDDVESYVYRNDNKEICIPGVYLHQAVIHAAKFCQDPRSPRKSAMDLFKAGLVMNTELATLGVKDWDVLDHRRVVVQRNGITRVRPMMHPGWKATFELTIILPEYINRHLLQAVLVNAGKLIGLADNRPSYGRFSVTLFD